MNIGNTQEEREAETVEAVFLFLTASLAAAVTYGLLRGVLPVLLPGAHVPHAHLASAGVFLLRLLAPRLGHGGHRR